MKAKVVRLASRRELIARDAAEDLDTYLRDARDIPDWVRRDLRNAVRRVTHPDTEQGLWPPGGFAMIGRHQTSVVWEMIRELPARDRPIQVRDAFMLVLLNLRHDTGEVMLGREEFARLLGISSDNVSRVMGTLERLGAIRREREGVPGLKGRGRVVYFINADVGWKGSLAARQQAAATAPPLLKLMRSNDAAE